jgi:hypothetical protein
LHPLESAALSRRTPKADIQRRCLEARRLRRIRVEWVGNTAGGLESESLRE